MQLPSHLSAAFVVATLLPLLLGVVNYTVQTKKILGQWPLPAQVSPYLLVVGSFLTGATSFVAAQSPFVLNAVTGFMMFVAGVYSLTVGQRVGSTIQHFGGNIFSAPSVKPKVSPDAVTDPPPPPTAAA